MGSLNGRQSDVAIIYICILRQTTHTGLLRATVIAEAGEGEEIIYAHIGKLCLNIVLGVLLNLCLQTQNCFMKLGLVYQ